MIIQVGGEQFSLRDLVPRVRRSPPTTDIIKPYKKGLPYRVFMYNEWNMEKSENIHMPKKYFTEEEILNISNNPHVKSVSSKGITYTDEFKRIFIAENENGKLPRQIFEENGFDIEVIGIVRVHRAASRWRTAYNKSGILGLRDTRKDNSGRPTQKELSLEEKNAKLEAQIQLLRAENELLKKLDRIERRLEKNE